MTDLSLSYTPATTLAGLIREKKVSPVEVVQNSLARIEEVNGALNAFCFTYPEEALAQAKEAERAVMAGEPLGPLHGVPIAIKDLTPTKGKRTTLGSKIYENWVPDFDVPIVERLRAAGSILVGKTTTPEFAYAGFCKSALWGDTNNPWDTTRSPGGSSGGSGAAVGTGCVPLAEGTDAGGSVRIPAAYCGTVGLKPTFGRIPLQMLPTAFDDLLHFGPLSRTVADAALFLSVTQGPDDRDFLSLPTGPEIQVPPPSDIRGLKLAVNYDFGFYAIDDDVRSQTREAARALEDAGATVEEVEIAWTRDVIDRWVDHWGVLQAACFGQHLDEGRDQMDPVLVSYMDRGLAMGAVDFKNIEIFRTQMWEDPAADLRRVRCAADAHLRAAAPAERHARSRLLSRRRAGVLPRALHDLSVQLPASVPCARGALRSHGVEAADQPADRRPAPRRQWRAADRRCARGDPSLGRADTPHVG